MWNLEIFTLDVNLWKFVFFSARYRKHVSAISCYFFGIGWLDGQELNFVIEFEHISARRIRSISRFSASIRIWSALFHFTFCVFLRNFAFWQVQLCCPAKILWPRDSFPDFHYNCLYKRIFFINLDPNDLLNGCNVNNWQNSPFRSIIILLFWHFATNSNPEVVKRLVAFVLLIVINRETGY